jgi:hypothetical protein
MRRIGLYGICGFGWRNRSVVFRILKPLLSPTSTSVKAAIFDVRRKIDKELKRTMPLYLNGRAARRNWVGTVSCRWRSGLMTRYFFDIREGDSIVPDEEGLEFPHVEAAQEEAADSLADLVRDKIRGQPHCHMAIEVRDNAGPVVEARFVWELRPTRP